MVCAACTAPGRLSRIEIGSSARVQRFRAGGNDRSTTGLGEPNNEPRSHFCPASRTRASHRALCTRRINEFSEKVALANRPARNFEVSSASRIIDRVSREADDSEAYLHGRTSRRPGGARASRYRRGFYGAAAAQPVAPTRCDSFLFDLASAAPAAREKCLSVIR